MPMILKAAAVGEDRVGGRPTLPPGTAWPRCRSCKGPLRFAAQARVEGGLLVLFFCQNRPGLCDDWDARAGCNAAFLVTKGETASPAPQEAEKALLKEARGLAVESRPGTYEDLRVDHAVLGQVGGSPAWIQADETPACPACKAPMKFALQLEESAHPGLNFGGAGSAYAFTCCSRAAVLWQQ